MEADPNTGPYYFGLSGSVTSNRIEGNALFWWIVGMPDDKRIDFHEYSRTFFINDDLSIPFGFDSRIFSSFSRLDIGFGLMPQKDGLMAHDACCLGAFISLFPNCHESDAAYKDQQSGKQNVCLIP